MGIQSIQKFQKVQFELKESRNTNQDQIFGKVPVISRDRAMADKLMYNPNDYKQNFPYN